MSDSTELDPIIAEIHETGRKISERFDGDLFAICEDARERQKASGRPVWSKSRPDEPIQKVDSFNETPPLRSEANHNSNVQVPS